MDGRLRQIGLMLFMGFLPAAVLTIVLGASDSLLERMRENLHQQRASALRILPVEGGLSVQKSYVCSILATQGLDLRPVAGTWPVALDPATLLNLRSSYASETESGVEIGIASPGPGILWMIPTDQGFRVAYQTRRSFYARLESWRALMWTAGLLLAGATFVLFVLIARKLADVFNDMEIKNQELERANRNLEELGTLKTTFLALVSHELRTPLARLTGQLNLIRQSADRLPDELRRRFDEMSVEIAELGRMTKNALDLTRLQSEDLAARIELGQISPVVTMTCERARAMAEARGLAIEIQLPETPPVSHDPYLLERILDNLLVNAVKYAAPASTIRFRGVEESAAIRIEIDSSGPVIPAADRERIFEKFYRGEGGIDVPGSGLGLYLVRQFVLMMGGRAWVEPIPDGNRFAITLPIG
ncbi:MAG TPA: ATP-binding protein [Candidatus Ozemobacteraceae bacterium]|nr:ATP-binding protein [Candidatus Ozemobacteraceae bacterium]